MPSSCTNKMKFACTDHIDNAIDDVVDLLNVAPEVSFIREWKNVDGTHLVVRCDFCLEPATYVLTHKAEAKSAE